MPVLFGLCKLEPRNDMGAEPDGYLHVALKIWYNPENEYDKVWSP